MLNEGHVPTVAEQMEVQDMSGSVQHKLAYNHEAEYVGRRHYSPEGADIPESTVQTLAATASPWRWVRKTEDEVLLLKSRQALLQESARTGKPQTMSDYFRANPKQEPSKSVIHRAYEVVRSLAPYGTPLDTHALDRLAALSRFSRNQLAEQGINADKVLAQRSKVSARASVPLPIHNGTSIRPVGFSEGDDTQVLSQAAWIPGRAMVVNPKTGKRTEYAKPFAEEDPGRRRAETLKSMLMIANLKPDQEAVADSMYPEKMVRGSSVTNKPWIALAKKGFESRAARSDYLRSTKADQSELNAEQLANVEAVTRKLETLYEIERGIGKGGEVPTDYAITEMLFPGKEEPLTPLEQQAVETAKAKLHYASMQVEAKTEQSRLKQEELHERLRKAGQWVTNVRREFRQFAEKLQPAAVKVVLVAGSLAIGVMSAKAAPKAVRPEDR